MPKPHNPGNIKAQKELVEALLQLKNVDEGMRFLRDVCTPKEMADLADRWLIARILDEGKLSYRDIHDQTGISVTTIGRVARFLQQEAYQGYRLMIDRLKSR
jgi:TrpR-related protein YerC/YecD